MKRMLHCEIIIITLCVSACNLFAQSQNDYYGVHATELTSVSLTTLDHIASMLDSANIRWVRMNFRWDKIQPTESQWMWGDMIQRVNIILSHNIDVLGLLYKIPDWASSAPNGTNPILVPYYPPRDTLEWMAYIDSTVTKLKGLVTHFEIWNEEDGGFFYVPIANTKPRKFFEILRTGYNAVKKANSSATVLIGGLTSQVGTFPKHLFLDSLFAMGAAQYFDVMNVHYYRYEDDPIGTVRSVMSQYKKAAPIWVTETNNWRSLLPNNAEQRAADSLASWMTALRNQKPDKIFWFNLTDFTGGQSADSTAWGLFKQQSYTTTLVYNALKNFIALTTDVAESSSPPSTIYLEQNYPNPFNPTTTIRFSLPQRSHVTLKVFNVLGRSVATLVNSYQSAGSHTVDFDGSNFSSGVYFYRLIANGYIKTKKLLLLK